jgi:hypothetical protein
VAVTGRLTEIGISRTLSPRWNRAKVEIGAEILVRTNTLFKSGPIEIGYVGCPVNIAYAARIGVELAQATCVFDPSTFVQDER